MKQWPKIEAEKHDWKMQDYEFLTRSQKRKILPTYDASVPLYIGDRTIDLPNDLTVAIFELGIELARFDESQAENEYAFPAVLLRSESMASSRIERMTSSLRNVALGEVTDKAPKNALEIVQNVFAMRKALALPDDLTVENIIEIQRTLLINTDEQEHAGKIRTVQNWIGGTNYSPHGALFVPPHPNHVLGYLDDLIVYSNREDILPIVKAIILHAQFETIHPFIDGNGRTGRTLLHKILRKENVLNTTVLPISAGLLNKSQEYMEALLDYQQGNPIAIIEMFVDALETALVIGRKTEAEIRNVLSEWEERIHDRKDSHIWKLIHLLVEQPVVTYDFVTTRLNITDRSARNLIDKAIEAGIVKKVSGKQRQVYFQSQPIIDLLDEAAANPKIYRNRF